MPLSYLLYQSVAVEPADPAAHQNILDVSQKNNLLHQVTGFLYREGDFFIQYLEGPKGNLYTTTARIGRDKRHERFTILADGLLKARHFPDWQMGFVTSDNPSLSDLLDVSPDALRFGKTEPFELVEFLAANAECLSRRAQAA